MSKPSILSQVMRPGDWVKLGILIVVFVISWFWVLKAYTRPFDYDKISNLNLTNKKLDF